LSTLSRRFSPGSRLCVSLTIQCTTIQTLQTRSPTGQSPKKPT
jgi:hypothetical protein